MCIAICDKNGCRAPNTIPHIFVYRGRAESLWVTMAEWITERLGKNTTLPARLILLGIAERDSERWLVKEMWGRLWRAWTMHQIWTAWTVTMFGGRTYPALVGVAQIAWHKTVQAMRARWMIQKVDPVEGPPKLPKEWQDLGMVSKREGVIQWQQKLPQGLMGALQRRQERRPHRPSQVQAA